MFRTLTGLTAVLASLPATADTPPYPDLPAPISSFGAAVVGDHVYVYGGHAGKAHNYSTETTLGEFRRLDLKKPEKWEDLPGGPKLQGLALVANKGKLYRIGGMQPQNGKNEKSDTKSLASCAVFDPAAGTWSDIEPLPEPRSSHDAVVLDDTIYVFGGWRLNGKDGKSEWYAHGWSLDVTKPDGKWNKIDQPFQRRALTMAAHGGRVYVLGGLNAKGGMELTFNVFNPMNGVWSEGPALPGEQSNGFSPASAVLGDRFFVALADGKVYRMSTNAERWEEVTRLKDPRFVARMVPAAEHRLIVLAGSSPGVLLGSIEAVEVRER
jgi:N-acetylneuraminic acid mutarotase